MVENITEKCTVTYRSFHPLEIAISCPEKEFYTGKISVRIIDVEIKIMDLSMGMPSMKGAGAYSKADIMQIAVMEFEELPVDSIYKLFSEVADKFEEVAEITREHFRSKAMLDL
jgi:hypothetical protein